MKTLQLLPPFAVHYAPELAQYVVERGNALRVVPTPTPFKDEDAQVRAVALCEALNRVYAGAQIADTSKSTKGNSQSPMQWHSSVDGSPEDAPLDPTQADVE